MRGKDARLLEGVAQALSRPLVAKLNQEGQLVDLHAHGGLLLVDSGGGCRGAGLVGGQVHVGSRRVVGRLEIRLGDDPVLGGPDEFCDGSH